MDMRCGNRILTWFSRCLFRQREFFHPAASAAIADALSLENLVSKGLLSPPLVGYCSASDRSIICPAARPIFMPVLSQ